MGKKKTKASKIRALNLLKRKEKTTEDQVEEGADFAECDYCSFKASSFDKLEQHVAKCGKQSLDLTGIIGEPEHICDICNQTFKYASGLIKHKQRHEPPGGFICSHCKEPFLTEADRNLHKETMHKTFKCMICNEKFLSENQFLEHIDKMHDGRDREYAICTDCGAHFRQKSQLKLHRESKCGTIRSHECQMCGSKFLTQNTLNAHLLIHTGVKKYLCNFCGSSFLSRGQLQVHERSHTKEKPYQCSECDKAFAHRESLVTHSSLHTGIKPYMCQCCNSQFSCIGNLIKHRRTRPQTCGLPKYTNVKIAPRASTKVPGSLVMKPSRKRRSRNAAPEILSVEVWNQEDEDAETGAQVNSSSGGSQMKELSVNSMIFNNEQNINAQPNQVVYGSPNENVFFVSNDKEYMMPSVEERPAIEDGNLGTSQSVNQIIIVEPFAHSGWETSDDRENIDIVYTTTNENAAIIEETENEFDDNQSNPPSSGPSLQHLEVEPVLNKDQNTSQKKEQEIDEYYECDMCSKRFRIKKSLSMHFAMLHRQRSQLDCKYCDKSYTSKKLLDKHIVYHGPNGDLTHKCPCCKLHFVTREEMQAHAQNEHEDRLKCTICNKFYKDLDCIAAHVRTMHRDTPKKKKYTYICAKCGRKFNSRIALGDHELGDCGRAPIYKCDHCGKALHSQGSWKTHQLIHTGDLPFECSFCKKRFRTQGQVKIHERSHSGEKPFSCQQCPKTFAHRESLMTHMSLHTGLKRFMCQCCSSRFSCISNLQAHRRTHKDTCGQLPLMTKAQYGYNLDNGNVLVTEDNQI